MLYNTYDILLILHKFNITRDSKYETNIHIHVNDYSDGSMTCGYICISVLLIRQHSSNFFLLIYPKTAASNPTCIYNARFVNLDV